jgi:hypothetical protein
MVQAARERYRALDAKIERMEAEEERCYQQARTPAKPAFDMAQWKQQDYAESARWEQQQFLSGVSAGGVVLSLAKPSGATGYCIVASGNLWKDTRLSLKPSK